RGQTAGDAYDLVAISREGELDAALVDGHERVGGRPDPPLEQLPQRAAIEHVGHHSWSVYVSVPGTVGMKGDAHTTRPRPDASSSPGGGAMRAGHTVSGSASTKYRWRKRRSASVVRGTSPGASASSGFGLNDSTWSMAEPGSTAGKCSVR